jgi:hypothetical protein
VVSDEKKTTVDQIDDPIYNESLLACGLHVLSLTFAV